MDYLVIAVTAFLASLVTFYSGFGLGTILMPTVALFFPLPTAIALTAVVHLIHNLLKTMYFLERDRLEKNLSIWRDGSNGSLSWGMNAYGIIGFTLDTAIHLLWVSW